jgi:preprotein translocase SecE subunit
MATEKTGNGVYNFFKVRWGELNNVTWPTQKQAVHSMILVLTIMLIVGVFLGFVDAGLSEIVLYLIG